MKRREFITLIGAGALAAPHLARAQEMRRIGVLVGYADSDPEARAWVAAFREELRNVGWVEGRTVLHRQFSARRGLCRSHPISQSLLARADDLIE